MDVELIRMASVSCPDREATFFEKLEEEENGDFEVEKNGSITGIRKTIELK